MAAAAPPGPAHVIRIALDQKAEGKFVMYKAYSQGGLPSQGLKKNLPVTRRGQRRRRLGIIAKRKPSQVEQHQNTPRIVHHFESVKDTKFSETKDVFFFARHANDDHF